MRLLYLFNTIYNSGGMERVLIEKANFLADAGNEVSILTYHQRGRSTFFPLHPSVRHVDVNVNINFPFLKPIYRRRLRRYIMDYRPDICISMCGRDLDTFARMDDIPCVRMAEFHFSYESFRIRGRERRLAGVVDAISRLDRFVVLTEEDMKHWSRFNPRVSRIYNPSPFTRTEMAPLERRHCICVGRMETQKNYRDMVKVWALVNEKHPEWELDIYGGGRLVKEIRSMISELSLDGKIHIHGPVRNIREKMMESSVLLMTSIYEGFPMALVEAASVGLPAVSYACPSGPEEIIENGVDGFVVPVGDVEGMAFKVCALLEDEQLRRSMGRSSFLRSSRFSKEVIMSQWTALFSQLLLERNQKICLPSGSLPR